MTDDLQVRLVHPSNMRDILRNFPVKVNHTGNPTKLYKNILDSLAWTLYPSEEEVNWNAILLYDMRHYGVGEPYSIGESNLVPNQVSFLLARKSAPNEDVSLSVRVTLKAMYDVSCNEYIYTVEGLSYDLRGIPNILSGVMQYHTDYNPASMESYIAPVVKNYMKGTEGLAANFNTSRIDKENMDKLKTALDILDIDFSTYYHYVSGQKYLEPEVLQNITNLMKMV